MKAYVIHGEPDGGVTLHVDGVPVTPARAHALCRGARPPFAYGGPGEGARVLALAILLDAFGQGDVALEACGTFAAEFLGTAAADKELIHFDTDALKAWFKSFAIGWDRA